MRNAYRSREALALAVSLAFLVPSTVSAGPWVDPNPGHGYVSLSYSNYEASQYLAGLCQGGCSGGQFDVPVKFGKKLPITIPFKNPGEFTGNVTSNYVNNSLQFYGEASLGGNFAFVAQMPLVQSISQRESKGADLSTTHPGDLVFGFKYQIPLPAFTKGFAFGPQVYITTPTGDVSARGKYSTDALNSANQPLPLPTGNGTVDIETRMSAGYSFYPIPVFVIGEVGYHHHWNNAVCNGVPNSNGEGTTTQKVTYSDDVPWSFQVGGTYQPKKPPKWFHHLTLIGVLHGTKSMENGYIDKTGDAAYLRPCGQTNNSTFFSAGGQIMIFPIKWVGLTYSVEHVINGGNVGYGLTNTVGLAAQF
jgi:hypothetical protein